MAKSKIDETLKNFMETLSPEKSKSSADAKPNKTLGDPDCPHCHGLGYVRRESEPGSPDFGKLEICTCRRSQVTQAVRDRLFSISHLEELKNMTFEKFNPRGRMGMGEAQANSLEWAYNLARQYAGKLQGWLVIQGGFGCGKTHLAAAVANNAVEMGVPTLFLTVPDLLDNLRFSFDSEEISFEKRFEEIRSAPLLVLDDFGTQNATAWAQEKLFQIINYRYINKLPLVVTTNIDLDDIDARIRSRLLDPDFVSIAHISAPDYRHPTDDMGHPELSSLDLHASRTFASFDDRTGEGLPVNELKSLEKAVKAATAFAAKPRGWLMITGTYGCGKTHLAAAIANFLSKKGNPPLFISVPDLLDHLRATFSPDSHIKYDQRFDEIRTSPMLILDDLGAQSTSPWAREKLQQLFNYRYNAELPTVITMNVDLLEKIDEGLRVRFLDDHLCSICTISAPAYHSTGKGRKKPARG